MTIGELGDNGRHTHIVDANGKTRCQNHGQPGRAYTKIQVHSIRIGAPSCHWCQRWEDER